ncbi:hypothetical protein SCE1572_29565 [Sorangium cellulosum So0157-2]|uniref:Uncharacterized protein n=1 Tax=Sorangium cellulosum So0157-2 TaxID=1254432 RepID=S4Y0G7_SORCE|nr:hypothetical protein SCE1572_29565 [Sorangium cellulosum So0157-2]
MAPGATSIGVHGATSAPSTSTRIAAPATHRTARRWNTSVGPCTSHSSPAAPAGLPTTRLPRRNDRSSIGPLGGTPTDHRPSRPGQSCTVTAPGAAVTSTASGRNGSAANVPVWCRTPRKSG